MKTWLKDYFSYTRGEQRGLIILLGLMLFSILFSLFSPLVISPETFDMSRFQEQVEALLSDTSIYVKSTHTETPFEVINAHYKKEKMINFLDSPFYFDPNNLDGPGWKKTGMNARVIGNILRYREKGGVFRVSDDLKKIYGMPDSLYVAIRPYIKISIVPGTLPKPVEKHQSDSMADNHTPFKPSPDQKIELNSADSSELKTLPGIGPFFASRIITYREMLGGYVDISQLLEVRGMDSARFSGISDKISVDAARVYKMDLNDVSFKVMLRHPYFEYYLVKAIFSYKDRIGHFDSIGQLQNVDNMYPELYRKIKPYLRADSLKIP